MDLVNQALWESKIEANREQKQVGLQRQLDQNQWNIEIWQRQMELQKKQDGIAAVTGDHTSTASTTIYPVNIDVSDCFQ